MNIIVQVGALRSLAGPGSADRTLSVNPSFDDNEMALPPSGEMYRRSVHTYPGCFGLPYQDHNYGAPPPITPPSSPPPMKINGHIDVLEDLSKPTLIATEEIVDDSITRCICEYQHDDGYMIFCDLCSVWQHIDCMGIDRNNIPDSYYCERCQVRPVDVERAKLIQSRKKEELANLDTSATDTDPEELANRLAALDKKSLVTKKANKQRRSSKLKEKIGSKQKTMKEKKGLKKEKENLKFGNLKVKFKNAKDGSQKEVKPKNRRNTQTVCKVNGEQWKCEGFDRFEDAKENQYSKDVQEIFSRYNVNGINMDNFHSDSERLLDQLWCLGQTAKKQVIIEAKESVLPGLAVLEYKGIVLLRQHYVDSNLFFNIAHPHVLFYSKFEDIDLCIDSSSYGNRARYIRRSCSPNAEVRHLVEHGRIHFVIFSNKEIEKGEEITIPFDYNYQECMYCVECSCLRNNCTVSKFWKKMSKNTQNKTVKRSRLKRPSGNNNITIKTELSPLKSEILKIQGSIAQSPVKAVKKVVPPIQTTPVKEEPKSVPEKVEKSPPLSISPVTPEPSVEVKEETDYESHNVSNTSMSPVLSTPEKLEPDDCDHKMTREERKMNAIMKAFEKLEKREERRKEALARIDGQRKSQDEPKLVVEVKVSSEEELKTEVKFFGRSETKIKLKLEKSTGSEETSDAKDEPHKPETPQKIQRKGRKRPLRRRSRVYSTSAAEVIVSPDESSNTTTTYSTPNTPLPFTADATSFSTAGFKFLKTKKHLFNEWLTEKGNDGKPPAPAAPLEIKVDETLFVPCLPSPRNAMDHIQRRNSQSAGSGKSAESSCGSAKKRWLRQAMHEVPPTCDSRSMSPVHGCTSPNPGMCSPVANPLIGSPTPGASPSSSPPVDFVTPLKKRRLARESLSQDVPILSAPSTPSTVVQSNPSEECSSSTTKEESSDIEGIQGTTVINSLSNSDDKLSLSTSNCYKSDSTDLESEAESSVQGLQCSKNVDNLNGSADNSRLSDNLTSDSNSALSITADPGVVTDSLSEKVTEKTIVNCESKTAETEMADNVLSNCVNNLDSDSCTTPPTLHKNIDDKNEFVDIEEKYLVNINRDNLFEDVRNDVIVTKSVDNPSEEPMVTESCETLNTSNSIADKLYNENDNETKTSDDLGMSHPPGGFPSDMIEDNVANSEVTTSSAIVDVSNAQNISESADFTTDIEASAIVKENGFSCNSLSHGLEKVESFGFIPSLKDNFVGSTQTSDLVTKGDRYITSEPVTSSTLFSTSDNIVSSSTNSSDIDSNQVLSSYNEPQSPNKVTPEGTVSGNLSQDNKAELQPLPSVVAVPSSSIVTSPLANVTSPLANVTLPLANVTLPLANVTLPLANVVASVSPPLTEQSQPCKKKVSLLEYRKRLKSKGKDSNVSKTSSIPKNIHSIATRITGSSSLPNLRGRLPPSLPSLPLFVNKNNKKKEMKEKKSWHGLSLTERLRQEFGVEASEDDEKSDISREGSLTPPPPPPPPPVQKSSSPRLKFKDGDEKTVATTVPSVPHPSHARSTPPPPPPPPPKGTSGRIPSLMSIPTFANRTVAVQPANNLVPANPQLLPVQPQTLVTTPPVLVGYQALNGSAVNSQTSPQTVPYHQPVTSSSSYPTSPGFSTNNTVHFNNRYRRNSSPSQPHHKGREVPLTHSYNHTSESISRSEWSNGRRTSYSGKYN